MAFLFSNQFSLTLFLISLFLSSSHARDSQYFSKVGRARTSNRGDAGYSNQQAEKNEEQTDGNYRSFINQDGDNPHGLYGTLSPTTIPPPGSPPPKHTSTTKPTISSWRPKNYNTESYVTPLAEESSSVDEETHSYPTTTTTRNNGNDAVGGKYRNSQLQGNEQYSNFNNVDEENRIPTTVHQKEARHTTANNFPEASQKDDSTGATFVKAQGMSDTRYLENGKFFYDVQNHVYSQNHPYEKLKATNRYSHLSSNNYGFLPNAFTGYKSYDTANNDNSMDLNYQNDGELFEQDDSDLP
ncbi:hypothetical protein OROGR_003118 [Orobanche gracilis]